jgi:hypothetical protein
MTKIGELDVSMLLYKASNTNLVSARTALLVSTELIREVYGEEELTLQEPLRVSDDVQNWIVQGSRAYSKKNTHDEFVKLGPIEIVISKFDCRILKFVQPSQLELPTQSK